MWRGRAELLGARWKAGVWCGMRCRRWGETYPCVYLRDREAETAGSEATPVCEHVSGESAGESALAHCGGWVGGRPLGHSEPPKALKRKQLWG